MKAENAPTIGLGVLSWRGYTSLRAALNTYRAQDLFSLFDEKFIFLPEMAEEGVTIAREFGMNYAGSEQNLGILGGFQALAQNMTSDYILLLENDFGMIEDLSSARAQIGRAMASLTRDEAQVWRFRHRTHPGSDFAAEKVLRYWPKADGPIGVKMLAALARRWVRPDKARKFIGPSVFFHDDRAKKFPELVRQNSGGDFLVRSDVLNWSNNPFLINRKFFLDVIIPAALNHPTKRLLNGFPTLERELNGPWWRAQRYWIGIANPGLFSHARYGDRGY
jgi:hypothetical protein